MEASAQLAPSTLTVHEELTAAGFLMRWGSTAETSFEILCSPSLTEAQRSALTQLMEKAHAKACQELAT
jgi:hypothetical protein